MAAKLKEALRLWSLYARMDLNWILQDFRSAFLVVLCETAMNLSSVAGILLLAVRFGGAGGLAAPEVLFLLGFYQLGDGLTNMLFGGFNVMNISRRVGRGQLDHMLIQPRSLALQLLTEGFLPFSGSSGFLIGVLLTAWASARLGLSPTPLWLAELLLLLALRTALMLSQSYLYASLAFYKPVACEEISSMILDLNNQLAKFPLLGLPKPLLAALVTVLPSGLLAYVPTLTLLKGLDLWRGLALPLAVTAAFSAAAFLCFRRGLAHYQTYSCNRYKEMGHRN